MAHQEYEYSLVLRSQTNILKQNMILSEWTDSNLFVFDLLILNPYLNWISIYLTCWYRIWLFVSGLKKCLIFVIKLHAKPGWFTSMHYYCLDRSHHCTPWDFILRYIYGRTYSSSRVPCAGRATRELSHSKTISSKHIKMQLIIIW